MCCCAWHEKKITYTITVEHMRLNMWKRVSVVCICYCTRNRIFVLTSVDRCKHIQKMRNDKSNLILGHISYSLPLPSRDPFTACCFFFSFSLSISFSCFSFFYFLFLVSSDFDFRDVEKFKYFLERRAHPIVLCFRFGCIIEPEKKRLWMQLAYQD